MWLRGWWLRDSGTLCVPPRASRQRRVRARPLHSTQWRRVRCVRRTCTAGVCRVRGPLVRAAPHSPSVPRACDGRPAMPGGCRSVCTRLHAALRRSGAARGDDVGTPTPRGRRVSSGLGPRARGTADRDAPSGGRPCASASSGHRAPPCARVRQRARLRQWGACRRPACAPGRHARSCRTRARCRAGPDADLSNLALL